MRYRFPDVMYGVLEIATQFPVFAEGHLARDLSPSLFLLLYSDPALAQRGAIEAGCECEVVELVGGETIAEFLEQPAAVVGPNYRIMIDRIDDRVEEAMVLERESLVHGLRISSQPAD